MGGEVVPDHHKFAADFWIYYKRLERIDFPPDKPPQPVPPRYKQVHWLFITECFFSYGRRDIDRFTLNFSNPQAMQSMQQY